jgi:ParB family chromosome partitioning protein
LIRICCISCTFCQLDNFVNFLFLDIFDQIVEDNLSVRQVEELIRDGKTSSTESKKEKPKHKVSEVQNEFTERLSDKVAAKVQIKKQPNGNGKVIINFNSEVDLNRIIEILND